MLNNRLLDFNMFFRLKSRADKSTIIGEGRVLKSEVSGVKQWKYNK